MGSRGGLGLKPKFFVKRNFSSVWKIIKKLDLFWHLWKLANENLPYTMLSHDTTIVLRVTHLTHIHSAISWFNYFVLYKNTKSILDKKITLASLLSKPFQYSLIELRILRRKASHRLPFRWQFNLVVKKVRLIFPPATDHGLTDAIFSADFRVIFKRFCLDDYFKLTRGCMTCDKPWAWWQLNLK